MSVVVTLRMLLRPEAYDGVKAGLAQLLPATREFKGCNGIHAAGDPDNHVITLYERWDRAEDQESYWAWRTERGETDLSAVLRAPVEKTVLEEVFSA